MTIHEIIPNKGSVETYDEELLIEEFKSLRRLILHSRSKGLDYVLVSCLSNEAEKELESKGYDVIKRANYYGIYW